jgi:hypothetical protein
MHKQQHEGIDMGEARRRKALGLGSANREKWIDKKLSIEGREFVSFLSLDLRKLTYGEILSLNEPYQIRLLNLERILIPELAEEFDMKGINAVNEGQIMIFDLETATIKSRMMEDLGIKNILLKNEAWNEASLSASSFGEIVKQDPDKVRRVLGVSFSSDTSLCKIMEIILDQGLLLRRQFIAKSQMYKIDSADHRLIKELISLRAEFLGCPVPQFS